MTPDPRTLDVRPILKAGGEPFRDIMQAVADLEPQQALRLLASFKPVPLFAVMEQKGFRHAERPLDGGDWEVVFTPEAAEAAATRTPAAPARTASDAWPAATRNVDGRGLMPPEPMVLALEAIEQLAAGEVLELHTDREPVLLYRELEGRGHSYRATPRPGGAWRVLIRHGRAEAG
jgi:uncharacterized protein (DUF2249 family)